MKHKLLLIISVIAFQIINVNAQTYNYYYGNIHSQSSYSDGNKDSATSLMTTPLQDFNYARSSQHIDFYGISDHNHQSAGMTNPHHYHQGIADANTANQDGSFVAMYGMEWGVISGGGHVVIYGCDSLMGWDANDYDIFVAQNDYTNLWRKINRRPGVFAYLAHPQQTDYTNLFTTALSPSADSAIIGMAARSGPAFSTNTTYSNPTTSDFVARYQDALKLGYHVGIGLDHDTHNSVFGRQTAGRLVVLATSLTRANILDAFRKMRFYSSDDWNTKVDFNIFSQPMGSIFTHVGSPTISVNVTDPDNEAVSSIQVYYGVPGSGTVSTVLTSNTNLSTLTFTPTVANNATYYYYLKITQADGDVIWTSPIWYNRNDAFNNAPVATFTTSSSTVCAGQTINLTDNSTNTPTSWNWTMTGGTPSTSTVQNPTVVYNTAGTYTLTLVASNTAGASAPVSHTITVNASPNVTATSQTICNGQQTTLTANGATTYSWNNNSTTSAITISPTATTTYTVIGTNPSGCSRTATATVTVNALPNVTTISQTICSGQQTTLTASGATTYSWNNNSTTSAITISPTATTTYTVTGTNSSGCSRTATATVTVNPLPNVTATSQTICSGQQTTLTATGATTYSWNNNSTTSAITISTTATTTYTVTGTNSSGCSRTATATVTVNALPNVTAISQTICNGQQTTLTASGATTYSWNNNSTTASITISPTATTTYTVIGTNSSGCTRTATATVTVNALPNVTATSQTICNGQQTTLTASGATTYSWNNNSTTSSITISPTATTTYTVTGTNSNGCTRSVNATVTVNPLPTISVNSQTICMNQPVVITATGTSSYSWSTGATTSSITVTPTVTTTYTVTGTDPNSCSSAAVATITVQACTGIANVLETQINIYPNPATEFLNIDLGSINGETTITLYDLSGQLVLDQVSENNLIQLKTSNLAEGMYLIKVKCNEGLIVKPIVISR